MTGEMRLAEQDDARQIQAIHAPVVRETAVSFELEVPAVDARTANPVDRRAQVGYRTMVLANAQHTGGNEVRESAAHPGD